MNPRVLVPSFPLAVLLASPVGAQCSLEEWLASDGLGGDRFGISVAMSGDLALVGAADRDEGVPNSGAAYVFRRQSGVWGEEQKLRPTSPGENEEFGLAVAIHGDVAICGVPNDDVNGFWSGSAEVFRFDGVSWNHEAVLKEPSTNRFGWSVDVEGDVIVVGSRSESSGANQSGAAYGYRHDGASWILENRLTPPDPAILGQFGHAVALSNDALVVGAWRDNEAGILTGAAYVYRKRTNGWFFEQKLNAADQDTFYRFGSSVDIDGDLIVCGAYEAYVELDRAGAAYVYRHTGNSWTQEVKLTASDADDLDSFGYSVAVAGESIAVGSRRDATPLMDSGSVYLYRKNGASWNELAKFPSAPGSGGQLGHSIAASGDRVIAGAWIHDLPLHAEAGAVAHFSFGDSCNAGQVFCGCSTNAPCGNLGDAQSGCSHSGGMGARLTTQGSANISAGDLVLSGTELPSGTALFFQGTSDVNSGNGSFFGDGLLCAGGTVTRLEVVSVIAGTASAPAPGSPSIAVTGAVGVGDSRVYQLWYRDLSGPCGAGFSLTNALRVVWK